MKCLGIECTFPNPGYLRILTTIPGSLTGALNGALKGTLASIRCACFRIHTYIYTYWYCETHTRWWFIVLDGAIGLDHSTILDVIFRRHCRCSTSQITIAEEEDGQECAVAVYRLPMCVHTTAFGRRNPSTISTAMKSWKRRGGHFWFNASSLPSHVSWKRQKKNQLLSSMLMSVYES